MGRAATKCACPIWIDGRYSGGRIHKSLKTRDWSKALRALDQKQTTEPTQAKHPIAVAVESYLDDCRARHLTASTLACYRVSLDPFAAYIKRDVRDIRHEHVVAYRAQRHVSPGTQRKEISHIRSFFHFCVEQEWISKNPALKIRVPNAEIAPTLPYEKHEVAALLSACDSLNNINGRLAIRTRARAKALVLLLLYSGFRVSDAVKLERSKLMPEGRLLIRVMKTGVPLYLKLPAQCIESLNALPVESEYFFWSGTSNLSAATNSAQVTIRTLGRKTGINAHAHRFRDTFAVELLLKKVDIRMVQILLGHKSLKTTEAHYAPWVSRMQKTVDEALDLLTYDD
jgi:site-specific recombinase XerD